MKLLLVNDPELGYVVIDSVTREVVEDIINVHIEADPKHIATMTLTIAVDPVLQKHPPMPKFIGQKYGQTKTP
jgi:hypothetical protein